MADHCHNTLGLPSASLPAAVTRRAALAGPLAVAALAPAFNGVPALAQDDTPVLRLYRQWEAMRAAEDAVLGEVPQAMLEARLLKAPSVCAADFAAKLAAFTCWGECVLTAMDAVQIWDEARMLLGRA
ncbi:hypothetical protein [Cereibacter sphaeroides]|uniref:hypothetical protein n=1 Tax=Cereibacter sphaeroides TaxID=1063 RepID=UPI00313C1067